MIQFNLLPDVKIEYLKARRTKRQVIMIAGLVSIASVVIMGLLFSVVNYGQKKHIENLSADIKEKTDKLKETEDIEKILTVQSQLESLNDLHASKPFASRLIRYIQEVTPSNVSIAELKVDFLTSSIEITGSSDEFKKVNKFADTLKFTNYAVVDLEKNPDDPAFIISKAKAFDAVVVSEFGRDTEGAKYTLKFVFDPTLFDSSKNIQLEIPKNFITTRSQVQKPTELFQAIIENPDEEGAAQ